jgi:hypothetical protein
VLLYVNILGLYPSKTYTFQQPFHYIKSTFAVQLHVVSRKVPQRPSDDECHGHVIDDSLWSLMTDCWIHDPVKRPSMESVVVRMKQIDGINSQ